MRELDYINSNQHFENVYFSQNNENIIIVTKKRLKTYKKHYVLEYAQATAACRLSKLSKSKKLGSITSHLSMPELNKCTRCSQSRRINRHGMEKQKQINGSPFRSKYIVHRVSEHRFDKSLKPSDYPKQTNFKIYRCQVGSANEGCCCSCNSDAMFEVMKGLYDCYKKKNCDKCNCILCGHLQKEDKLGEKKKGEEGYITSLKGKTPEEREKILRDLALRGKPLPDGKTASEKSLIDKVRGDLGLPVEPKTKAIRDKHKKAAKRGLLQPLEGKTPAEKEKILKGLHDMGIPLPVGRTPSEKALIEKISASTRAPSKATLSTVSPSEQLRRAKAEGLLTPLKGKTPEEREKILRGLAMRGMPLPEGQTPSEKKLINKVRGDLGLPIEPKTKATRDKHEKAAASGRLLPLEGKTPAEKEKILKDLHDMEIPLPLGRTPSEKSLIARITGVPQAPSKAVSSVLAPSERIRRAKVEGLLTPLEGKTPEEKENILKGLAMRGIPLPEGQSPSEKKLIDKVRADLGLPKEPKTKSIRDKHQKAADAGFLLPLEGKTPKQKEKILRGQHRMGIPLPEGRTPSEKSLIAKIKASSPPLLAPSEQMRSAKAEGLLTPLKGKTPEQKEKILRGLAAKGLPLPEAKTPSEKKLVDKVRAELGLPPEPKSKSIRDRHEKAAKQGKLKPLEGKTPAEKEKILKGLHNLGIPLPEGRTPSEKSLIVKIRASPRAPSKGASTILAPSERIRRAKAEGLMIPLEGKTPEQKEKILKGLAAAGLPLPEAKTPSDRKLVAKVRADLGLPPEPKSKSIRDKHDKAAAAGLLKPLEGKTPAQKEKILKGLHDLGIPLPVGRTPSEKSLIARISESPRAPSSVASTVLAPSERLRRAKAEGLLTPLKGKTPEQKEKILKGIAMAGLPLPEAKTPSEKNIIDKVRADLGLPPEPKSKSIRDKHEKAAAAGMLKPLEGKTPAEKEKILKGLHDSGIPLPVGRTPSEKSLIARISASPHAPSKGISDILTPSERMRRAKSEGLLTSLHGKTPDQKEKILRGLAAKGLPLPEAKTPSEKKLLEKVRADLGLPPEPKSKSIRDKHEKAAKQGKLQPLEGKTPAEKEKILKGLHNLGIPLPEGRKPSEKSLIAKIRASPRAPSKAASTILAPSERMRRAKAEGLLTPLEGKTPGQKEKILRGLAARGLPLPEAKTPSDKKLVDKVRADLGLPPEPKSKSIRDKHEKAAKQGKLQPLKGRTPAEKEKILKGLHDLGIPLPEGRTPSEKSLIAKIQASPRAPSEAASTILPPSERMRRAKVEGLLTPLEGKTPEQKEKILKSLAAKGLPLPEAKTPSEKKLVDKVRADLGLPPEPKSKSIREKHKNAAKQGKLQPLEGKTPAEKKKILKGLHDLGIPLPEGRTPSEKSLISKIHASPRAPSKAASTILAPSERMRRAKAEGLLTPLQGKTPEQREKILRGLAMRGMPLPEGQTPSEKKLIDKVRADLGLPKEPKTKSIRDKHEKAAAAGKLLPLEGRTPAEKEKILKGLHNMEIPLPEGRTPSEKSLIAKIQAGSRALSKAASTILAPSERMRRAKAEGLLTPLTGKAPEQKEKILKGLAMRGIPLPEGQTPSEKKLIDKVRADLGLPKEPKTKSIRDKHEKAAAAGLLQPLEGKTPKQKEKILRGQHKMGIPLPVGRTPSEKSLIAKIRAGSRPPSKAVSEMLTPSEQMRRAKAEGLLTPLKGKTPEQREKILRGLAMRGIPLPDGQSPSEKKLINKVRNDLGLPIEPKTKAIRDKHEEAAVAGILLPLEGKTPKQKENILRGQHKMGIPLPVGRTPSEKSLIAKVMASSHPPSQAISSILAHSEHMRRAKAEGLLTPLAGKTPEQREKILRGLAMRGIPLPEGQTPSEKKLINKVRNDLGLPIEPKTKAIRDKHEEAAVAGILLPLEGKTPKQKENILRGQHKMGIPLPVGRTPSEKSLIAKIMAGSRPPSLAHSEKMRKTKAEGLFTPLQGKPPEQKEKILKGLAVAGFPLPEAQTPSEKKLIDKVRADLGLPPEPKSKSIRDKHEKAAKQGKLQPLEGKTPAEKEKILKGLHDLGIPLPEGRTPSEKSLIAKIRARPRAPSKAASKVLAPSERMRRAKAEGLLTPLQGKTPEQREKILKGLAMKGMPLPEGQTHSEKKLIEKVRADLGLPIEPKSKSIRDKHEKAAAAGKLQPLEGKTPAEKEKILKNLHNIGIPLPEGRTASEKSLIAKIKATPAGKTSAVSSTKKGIGIGPAGVTQDLEEIVKTEKCDRGCGCDKKKIKFRHSYVKIKVTSPDISSLCDCDYECIPGVKNGVFVDSDGIKVTVGSAVGIPLYARNFNKQNTVKVKISKGHSFTHREHKGFKYSVHSSYRASSFESGPFTNNVRHKQNSSSSVDSYSTRPSSSDSNIYLQNRTPPFEGRICKSDKILKDLRRLKSLSDTYKDFKSRTRSSVSSLDSIFVIKSEISLYTSSSYSRDSLGLISVVDSSATPSSAQFSSFQLTDDLLSSSSLEEPTISDDAIDYHKTIGKRNILRTVVPQREYTILRMSQTKLNFRIKKMRSIELPNSDTVDPVVLFNHLPSKIGVSRIIDKIMAKKRFSAASSIFIVVPTSDEEAEDSSICVDSIKSSVTPTDILSDTSYVDSTLELSLSSLARDDEQVCGQGKKFYMKEVMSSDAESMYQNKPLNVLQHIEMDNEENCEVSIPKEKTQIVMLERTEGIKTDLMADISSDCVVKEYSTSIFTSSFNSEYYTDLDVISKQTTPLYPKGGSGNTFYWQLQKDCPIENSGKTPSFGRVAVMGPSSTVSRPVPRGAPSWSSFGDVGCTLFRHKRSGIYCTGMPSPSSDSFGGTKMLLSNTLTTTSYSDRRIFRHKSPGFYRLTDTRSLSAKSIVMLCDNYASPENQAYAGIDLRTSHFRNKPPRRLPDMRTPSPKSIMQTGSKPASKSSLGKKRRKRSSSSSSERIRFSDKPEVINADRPVRRRSPVKTPLCPETCSTRPDSSVVKPNQCTPLQCGCGASKTVDRTPCAKTDRTPAPCVQTSAPSSTATCPTCDQTDDYFRDQRPRKQEPGKPLACGCRIPVDSTPYAGSSASTRTDTCPDCGQPYDNCRDPQPRDMPGETLSCGCRIPDKHPTSTKPSEFSYTPKSPNYEPSNDCYCDSSRGEYNERINDWQASGEVPRSIYRQSPGGPPPSRASEITRSSRNPRYPSDEGEQLSCGCQKLDDCAPDPYETISSTKCPNSDQTSDCCCVSAGAPPPSPATSEFTRSSRNPCCEPTDEEDPLECGCQELDDCAGTAKCPNSSETSDCCCVSGAPPPSPATSQFTRSSKNPCGKPSDEDPLECGCQELDDCAPDPREVTSSANCPNSSDTSDCCCLENGVDCSETPSCGCSPTEPSDISCVLTCPDYEPSEDCYCESSRLESGDGNRSAPPCCECRFPTVSPESSECTRTDPCLSHVPLDNDYDHCRLGHDMHCEPEPYQYDACHQNDECPCVPDISHFLHKPMPFCKSHVPLRGCFHPGRHGHNLHFDPFLGCHPSVTSNTEICPCKGDYPSMRSCEPDARMCAGEQEHIELCSPRKQCSETYILTTPTSISEILNQQHGDTLLHSELTKKILDSTNRLAIYDSHDVTYSIAQTNSKYVGQNQANLPFERSRSQESYFCRNIFKKKKTYPGENRSKKLEIPAKKVTAETQDKSKELENSCGKDLCFDPNKSKSQEVPCGLEFCHDQNKSKNLENPANEDSCDCHNQSNMVDGTCGKKTCFGRNIYEKLKATVSKEFKFFQDITKKLEIFCDEEFSVDENKSKELEDSANKEYSLNQNKSKKLEGPDNKEPCSDQNKSEKFEDPNITEPCFDQNKSKKLKTPIRKLSFFDKNKSKKIKSPDDRKPYCDQNKSEKFEAPDNTEPCFDKNKYKKLKTPINELSCLDKNNSKKLVGPENKEPCFEQKSSLNPETSDNTEPYFEQNEFKKLKAPVNKVTCLNKNKNKKPENFTNKKYSSNQTNNNKLKASADEETCLYKNKPEGLKAPTRDPKELCFDQNKSKKKLSAPANEKSCLAKNKLKMPEIPANAEPGFDQNKSNKMKVCANKKSCKCQQISNNVENPCGKGVCQGLNKPKKTTVPDNEKSCWDQDIFENFKAPTNKKKTCLCKNLPKKLEVLYGKEFCYGHNKCKKSHLDQNINKNPNISVNTKPFYQEVSKRLKEYMDNQNNLMPQSKGIKNQNRAIIALIASNSRRPPQIGKGTSLSRLHNTANCDKIDCTPKYQESTLSQIDASTDPENQECDDTSQTENLNDECCDDKTMRPTLSDDCPCTQDKSTFIDEDVKQNENDAMCQYETAKRRKCQKILSIFTKLFQKRKKEDEASSSLKPSRSVQTMPDLGLCSGYQPRAQKVCDNENTQQPQQMPPYVVNPNSPTSPNYDYPYQHPCGWIHKGKLMKLRSDLSECTSGFKACKKKKWPNKEIILSFEDAVKYYAGMNLEQFRDLLPPLELSPEEYKSKKGKKLLQKILAKEKCEREKIKKHNKMNKCKKRKGNVAIEDQTYIENLSDEDEKNILIKYGHCECCYGPRLQEVVIPKEMTPEELGKLYPKEGMKLSVVDKTRVLESCST